MWLAGLWSLHGIWDGVYVRLAMFFLFRFVPLLSRVRIDTIRVGSGVLHMAYTSNMTMCKNLLYRFSCYSRWFLFL